MPVFDLDKFVNRVVEFELIKEKVARLAKGVPFAPHERVVHFIGPSGIGKSYLLEKFYKVFDDKSNYIPILIKLDEIKGADDSFVTDFLNALQERISMFLKIDKGFSLSSIGKKSDVLIKTINMSFPNQVLILLLDEMNVPRREESQGIEEYLLNKLLYSNKRAILVTAGRTHPMLNDFALRPSSTNTILLSPFDEKNTEEQVEKLKPGSGIVAGKLQELGGGIPGNTARLVNYLDGDPLTIPNELQAVQSLRTSEKYKIEERLLPVIEAICILSEFEPDDVSPLLRIHPSLSEYKDESLRELFIHLRNIQVGPGSLINWDRASKSFVMDENIRRIFEQELRLRNLELWRKLHCTAYQMYKDWGEEFNSQLFREKSTYHQRCLLDAGYEIQGCI
jgi:hypothetical protein